MMQGPIYDVLLEKLGKTNLRYFAGFVLRDVHCSIKGIFVCLCLYCSLELTVLCCF